MQEKLSRNTSPVTVYIDPDQRSDQLVAEPEVLVLSLGERNEARWTSERGTIEIRFDPARCPFRISRFQAPAGWTCLSGVPKSESAGKEYKYLVLLTTDKQVYVREGLRVQIRD
ncbi:MAG TPA: hypothetical protein VNQ79_19520 [Blastocatellia bacterium]|nr:hypothetical protein [Blastocatellia bacterium]